MSSKANTKEKFLETAAILFEMKGYNATGLNEILKESGCPKGSLYYHFPKGKEELAAAAVNLAGEKIRTNIKNTMDNIKDPVEAIKLNIENIADIIDKDKKLIDMSISLIALETYSTSEVLRIACEDIFNSLKHIYADKFIKTGMDSQRADELGDTIAAMIEGGIILSLTKQSGKSLRLIAKQIPNLINIKNC